LEIKSFIYHLTDLILLEDWYFNLTPYCEKPANISTATINSEKIKYQNHHLDTKQKIIKTSY
jgi:hypothetical protein